MSLQKLLSCRIKLCTLRYICIYFAIILLPVPSVAEDTSRNDTATGGLIKCKLTSRGNSVCTSPYLNVSICLFILLALVVIIQCTLILRLTWHRKRKEDDHDVNITKQEGTYSRINQAEFISSLSGKLERNDSIGSSSLNFLSPDLAASVNSLCNVCSLSDREAESKRSAPPATLRQDTLVYCEIGNDPENSHSCQYHDGRLNSVSSNQSTQYAFIKSLILEEGNSRPWSSSEIPSRKNGILRQEVIRCKQGPNVSTKQDKFSRPLNVQADVHASPERKGSTSSSTHGDEDTIKRDRLASYLEIVGDGNDRGVEEKNLRTSSDDDEEEQEEAEEEDVKTFRRLDHVMDGCRSKAGECVVSHGKGKRIPTYIEMTGIIEGDNSLETENDRPRQSCE